MGNYNFTLDLNVENTMSVINDWIKPKSKVLEFGPANGRLTKYLSEEKNCAVTIVEIDDKSGEEALKYAEESYVGEKLGNIENYYWTKTEKKYQYIIFADVLEHLRNPKTVLERCKEFLTDDGRILVSIPNIAHNSIIIELLKGNFEYQPVGLLDQTHVHFFTHKSFEKMMQECGICICQAVPVYSRVGCNEIVNSYLDIPVEVSQYLRKRAEGSIYQYVYNLSVSNTNIGNLKNTIKGLEIEEYEELESLFFYKKNVEEYCDEKRIGKDFFENEEIRLEIDLNELESSSCVRWHPIIYNGVFCVKRCEVLANEKRYTLSIKNSNISSIIGNLYIFAQNFPWIEFEEIPLEMTKGKLLIDFKVVAYRKDEEFYNCIKQIFSALLNQNEIIYDKSSVKQNIIVSLKDEKKQSSNHQGDNITKSINVRKSLVLKKIKEFLLKRK